MATWERAYTQALLHPVKSLAVVFWAWKLLLFLTVSLSPGPGYDTCATLLLLREPNTSDSATCFGHSGLPSILLRFVRWDSIYFLRVAERGYLFEQEWAWGYGYTKLLSILTSAFHRMDEMGGAAKIAVVGVGLSHFTHFLSVLALYGLTKKAFGTEKISEKAFCFLSALLHIITPAGAFLSAPYAEALFSLLNFAGFYLYASALHNDRPGKSASRDAQLLLAASSFATATTVRSNGIISGSLFAYDCVVLLFQILSRGVSVEAVHRLIITILGGIIVALGMILPQYVAYTSYCAAETLPRPWCQRLIPSIYTWVQSEYWNVGFLRYWTLSNLPLFCLAAPMLAILMLSSVWSFKTFARATEKGVANGGNGHKESIKQKVLLRLAIPQALLAVAALTSYHVQIINRISSGYPLWYWYIVAHVLEAYRSPKSGSHKYTAIVRGMVVYALTQAVLFGSFLPPA
ncbi:CAZyme family GT76 [Paecilomyces variotii]|nr:CAZyme family GT76 [Paecilomyces variotii]KAJ9233816.1 CAZyme family GT76 [Paecilomyces variotii]